MSAESEVLAALVGAAGVVALVQSRIYTDSAEQGVALPLIVFERRATAPVTTIHDGVPVAAKVTVAVSVWAKTRLVAEQIADAVQVAMGAVGVCINRFAHYDNDTTAHAAVLDFDVWEL